MHLVSVQCLGKIFSQLVVTALVDSMCNDAKDDMREMDQSKLVSSSHAVTSADGTWMTRGFHSKNATLASAIA